MLLKNQLIKTPFLRPFEFNLMSQWILSDGVISGMLPFSVYASNYDSDCVVSENQPVKITFTVILPIVQKHNNNPLYSFL